MIHDARTVSDESSSEGSNTANDEDLPDPVRVGASIGDACLRRDPMGKGSEMRVFTCAVAVMVVGALSACGGDGETRTVVVTQPGAGGQTTPPATPPPQPSHPPAETTPTQPLPTDTGGATAVQGTYRMTVAEESTLRGYSEGDELTWGAVTSCTPKCEVELRRENENGGFTTIDLPALGDTRYGRDSTGTIDCLGKVSTRSRTSLSVLKQRDMNGVPLATEIQGFVRARFTCANGVDVNEVLRVQGRLREPTG